ncbi:hypothetical protein [Aquimarina algicola]|uniref:GyrI-like small molecule binding domain-containing protein n=1 Tax=Aquimarina algicola TaxID=2589995 RepID=A0A504JHE3_9FLAO|nr:hypothetical protein [Aquimarina algicola]TPN87228.1 hypothetical protein FHK87_06470 [Aquimarina algicola]
MRKVVLTILILISGAAIWYFWIKKYDYEITFRANAAPGSVYQQVKSLKSKKDSITPGYVRLIDTILFKNVTQLTKIKGEEVLLDWTFTSIHDTISNVTVGIVARNNVIKHRLEVLTGSSSIVKTVKKDIIDFRKRLKYYTNRFQVVIQGEENSPALEGLIISSETKRYKKANEMMRSNAYLHPKLLEYRIQKKGYPFVKINHWNKSTDSIQLYFGFPAQYQDSLPIETDISYKKLVSQKSLKATYYGNYRTSDEAWFTLLEYAQKNNIKVKPEPLEIFYNNPMQGGDELQWKAEIFLPVVQ